MPDDEFKDRLEYLRDTCRNAQMDAVGPSSKALWASHVKTLDEALERLARGQSS